MQGRQHGERPHEKSIGQRRWFRRSLVTAGLAALVACGWLTGRAGSNTSTRLPNSAANAAMSGAKPGADPDGRELFTREWQSADPRSHGGDGLGPMFNDSSCVACHNQGGVGGGGGKEKNVVILTPMGDGLPKSLPPHLIGTRFVLHHASTDARYDAWKAQMSVLRRPNKQTSSERQAPALFGAGLIDKISESELAALAQVYHEDFPEVTGRVAETESGHVGRFGWKGQIARLDEFVITACAVELGLQTPDKPQPPMAHDPKYQAPGLDMSQAECDALIQFVRDLPRPRSQSTGTDKSDAYVAEGRTLFASVGCAACHVPTVGKAEGIYSDLLLHDMGQSLGDVGSSYGTLEHSRRSPSKPPKRLGAPLGGLDFAEKLKPEKRPNVAGPSEWRTPPLWGVRDSAPYLHDGRADTLQKAILLHDGEAQKSRELFDNLEFDEQQKVVAFLKSLAAPAE